MRASVIIPTRDRKGELLGLLAQLRDCLPADSEVIVVDDGSSDGTAAAAASLARVLRIDPGRGPARARNEGAAAASGDVLIFIDTDVTLPIGGRLLEDMVGELERDSELDCVITASSVLPTEASPVAFAYSLYHAYYMERLLKGHGEVRGRLQFFTSRLGAVRKKSFQAAGGFHEGLQGVLNEDGEFGARAWTLGFKTLYRSDFTHRHRYAATFTHMAKNYFGTAMVQAMIDRAYDTGADPSIGSAEKGRRLLALSVLLSFAGAWLLPVGVSTCVTLTLAAILVASFGRLRTLAQEAAPAEMLPGIFLVYIGSTPFVLAGYVWGLVRPSLIEGARSDLTMFSEMAER